MMDFISYAARSEDAVLFRFLESDITGCYIDLSCQDAPEGAITQSFYDRGWSGLVRLESEALLKSYVDARPRDRLINGADLNTSLIMASGVADSAVGFIRVNASDLRAHETQLEHLCRLNAKVLVLAGSAHENFLKTLHERFEKFGYRLAFDDGLNAYYVAADKQEKLSFTREPLSNRNAKELNERYRQVLALLNQQEIDDAIDAAMKPAEVSALDAETQMPPNRSISDDLNHLVKKVLKKLFNLPFLIIDQFPQVKSRLVDLLAQHFTSVI